MAIQIGKYKRPGIFIEEFDKSIIETPQSVDPLVNLVIGVSKKGPVNTPVKVSTLSEFQAIYGEIDRNLERRGSFFHRTVEKMLESSPVYAMNLLLTNDNLDRAEYQSISASSDITSDVKRLGPYRRYHDTTGFWKKDTESFLNLTRPTSGARILNITNLSDKPVSVFIYKSRTTGYDITAESWYGSIDRVPTFMNPKDFISDYMVDVAIVSGNWSDYRTLAQDKVWSNYFFYDAKLGSGLRKNLVLNFIQNRNVKTLGYYEGLSLIPYFRNRENKNLFIETNLNRDTEKTGIFCAFNIDAVENESVSTLIDLVGHTIANKNETVINFLSYNANISEEITFATKPLDLPGNVTANLGGLTYSESASLGYSGLNTIYTRKSYTNSNDYNIINDYNINPDHFYGKLTSGAATYSGVQTNHKNRTSWFADFTTWGIKYDGYTVSDTLTVSADAKLLASGESYISFGKINIKYSINVNAYAIINGGYLPVICEGTINSNYREQSFTIEAKDFESSGSSIQLYCATVIYDFETNKIVINVNKGGSAVIGVGANDIVLNTFKFRIKGDASGLNRFIPFNRYQKYQIGDNIVEGRFSPNIIGSHYGIGNGWGAVSRPTTVNDYSTSTFQTGFGGSWLNNQGSNNNADSYLNVENVHVDTSFLSQGSDLSNPLIHDNSSYIQTFYKNSPTKTSLFNDPAAPIGALGNQQFTGGIFSAPGLLRAGYVYNSRILSYSNVDRWNYSSLTPVFATSSTVGSEVGTCLFKYDSTTEQLYAKLDTGVSFNTNVSLNSGDLVSVWVTDVFQSSRFKIVVESIPAPGSLFNFSTDAQNHYFNRVQTGSRPILLIVDYVDYSNNKIYFLSNYNSSSLPILNAYFDDGKRIYVQTANILAASATSFTKTITTWTGGPTTAAWNQTATTSIVAGGITWTLDLKLSIPSGTTLANAVTAMTVEITNIKSGTLYDKDKIVNSDHIPASNGVLTDITVTTNPTGFNGTNVKISLALTTAVINGIFTIQTGKDTTKFTLEKANNDLFDYKVSYEGNGRIKYTFLGTDNAKNPANYRAYRRHRMFDKLVSLLNSADKFKRVMVLNNATSNGKISMENMSISDIITSTTQNKSFVLNTGLPNSEIVKTDWERVLKGFLTIYTNDDEVILGRNGFDTKMIGLTNSVTEIDPLIGDGIGVVSKYSDLYQNYYNGIINNGDYFQNSRTPSEVYKRDGYTVTFFDGEEDKTITGLNTGKTSLFAGYNYIMFTASFDNGTTTVNDMKFNVGDNITVLDSVLNRRRITILSDNLVSPVSNSATLFNDSLGATLDAGIVAANGTQKTYIYKVSEEVSYEKIFGVKRILDNNPATGFYYLNMFVQDKLESNFLTKDALSIRFKNSYGLTLPMPPLSNLDALTKFNVVSQSSSYKQSLELEYPATYDINGTYVYGTSKDTDLIDMEYGTWLPDNKVLVKADRYSELRIGDFLLSTGNRLSRIIDKRIYQKDTSLVLITCSLAIRRNRFGNDWQTYLYKSVDEYTYTYNALVFNGFRVRPASLPDGTEKTQESILNIVGKGTPLFRALTNKEAIDYRYLVDSFGLGLGERSKQQLADICGDRKDIFGFLNMPSVKSFKNSTSPSYVDGNGDLVVEYIAKGSNPDKAAAFTYTFADGEGSTCVGYFTPYIQVDDEGRQVSMPPAAHVATTYMRKHTSNLGGITPWTIAAGVTNGRVTNIIGLEHDYTNEDIEWLNQSQINPIVFKRNRGNVIETENTAQTLYKSALSYIHVREVLIELERELSRMLLDFQWQYNTPDIRAEIKLRADSICETYVNRNGLYNYFNKMDDENNTSEIIDNQIGVLDTYVEPIKGMGIIVNNVTILRTGAIDAGGFM